MSCGDEVGKYWNQISLITMSIDQAWDLTHAPGYVFDDTTMYVLTFDEDTCPQTAGNQPSNSLLTRRPFASKTQRLTWAPGEAM